MAVEAARRPGAVPHTAEVEHTTAAAQCGHRGDGLRPVLQLRRSAGGSDLAIRGRSGVAAHRKGETAAEARGAGRLEQGGSIRRVEEKLRCGEGQVETARRDQRDGDLQRDQRWKCDGDLRQAMAGE